MTLAILSNACWAGHPFITDDTGTQGAKHWQYELNTDSTRQKTDAETTRTQSVNTALTYGLTNTLDIAVNVPYMRMRTNTDPEAKESGIGDVTLIAKWRFFQREEWSLGLKPVMSFATGDDRKGLGNGRSTFALNGLAMYEKEALTWMATVGYTYNDNKVDARKQLWNLSTAVKYKVHDKMALLADIGTARNPDKTADHNPAFALFGVIYSPSESVDFDLGYKKGLNRAEVDAGWGAGLTVRW